MISMTTELTSEIREITLSSQLRGIERPELWNGEGYEKTCGETKTLDQTVNKY